MRAITVSVATSFWEELEKIARVPKAVKMYRRALVALQSGENLFHGTKPGALKDIAESGGLKVHSGTHGDGVYFWKGRPRSSYMRGPKDSGLWTKRDGVTLGDTPHDPKPYDPRVNASLHAQRRAMEISDTAVDLPARTTLSSTAKELRSARAAITKRRYRQMDARILHRAEADMQMRRVDKEQGSDHYRAPTKKELVRLLRRTRTTPQVKGTRAVPRTPKQLNDLYGSYDEHLGREVALDADGNLDYF